MTDSDFCTVMRFLAKHGLADCMFIFERDGELFVGENCNDWFYYACPDMEIVTVENLPVFEQAIKDCEAVWDTGVSYAGGLFACRLRGKRPLTMAYAHMPKQVWPLFDATGPAPANDVEMRKRMEEKWEKEAPPYFRRERAVSGSKK